MAARYTLVLLACMILLVSAFTVEAQNSPQDYLDVHNEARAQVGVGPMVWDDAVAAYAQSYANQRINDCNLIHSGGPYGENLFWGYGSDFSGRDATFMWIGERQFYDYNSNSCLSGQQCRHYTQVVWRNSVKLDCARVQCVDGAIFITCNYDGPGNFIGQRPY